MTHRLFQRDRRYFPRSFQRAIGSKSNIENMFLQDTLGTVWDPFNLVNFSSLHVQDSQLIQASASGQLPRSRQLEYTMSKPESIETRRSS